jgi:hypothetical protein
MTHDQAKANVGGKWLAKEEGGSSGEEARLGYGWVRQIRSPIRQMGLFKLLQGVLDVFELPKVI